MNIKSIKFMMTGILLIILNIALMLVFLPDGFGFYSTPVDVISFFLPAFLGMILFIVGVVMKEK